MQLRIHTPHLLQKHPMLLTGLVVFALAAATGWWLYSWVQRTSLSTQTQQARTVTPEEVQAVLDRLEARTPPATVPANQNPFSPPIDTSGPNQ